MRQRRERVDGRANRAQILVAAREVYAEQGAGAPFAAIADRAGVSRTTVSRHFPQRRDLDLAVLEDNVVQVEEVASSMLGRPDGLRSVFRFVVRLQFSTTAFHSLTSPADDDTAARLLGRVVEVFREVADSTERRQLADEATIDDLVVGLQLSAALSQAGRDTSPARLERAWALLDRALFASAELVEESS